jgi:hypothetical protein
MSATIPFKRLILRAVLRDGGKIEWSKRKRLVIELNYTSFVLTDSLNLRKTEPCLNLRLLTAFRSGPVTRAKAPTPSVPTCAEEP